MQDNDAVLITGNTVENSSVFSLIRMR